VNTVDIDFIDKGNPMGRIFLGALEQYLKACVSEEQMVRILGEWEGLSRLLQTRMTPELEAMVTLWVNTFATSMGKKYPLPVGFLLNQAGTVRAVINAVIRK